MYTNDVEAMRRHGVIVETLRTYRELEQVHQDFVRGFNGNKIDFLILVGGPGLAKSWKFESAPGCCYINNAASAWGLYRRIYTSKNKPLILDDIDGLLKKQEIIALMKGLTTTGRSKKKITWEKQNAEIRSGTIPAQFETTSRVCVILNEFPRGNVNLQAVLDRAKFVVFTPDATEVHSYVKTFWQPEHVDILDHINTNLDKIFVPSIRHYEKARQEKLLNHDWRDWLDRQWDSSEARYLRVIGEILAENITEGEAQEKVFEYRTGLKRSQYYEYKKRYLDTRGSKVPD